MGSKAQLGDCGEPRAEPGFTCALVRQGERVASGNNALFWTTRWLFSPAGGTHQGKRGAGEGRACSFVPTHRPFVAQDWLVLVSVQELYPARKQAVSPGTGTKWMLLEWDQKLVTVCPAMGALPWPHNIAA